MFNKKTCKTCEKKLPLSAYHKDSKNRDGYSASCGPCRNEKRRKIPEWEAKREAAIIQGRKAVGWKTPTPTIQTQPETIVKALVPILDERQTILDAISEKYGATFTITVAKDRTCHINIMQDGWKNTKKFRTPEELLACVL